MTDLKVAKDDMQSGDLGPIGSAVRARDFARVLLLADQPKDARGYAAWLRKVRPVPIDIHSCKLASPTDFGAICREAIKAITALRKEHGEDVSLTFHLSPGTSAMAAIWILLGKTRYPAELLEAHRETGVRTVSFPFDISAEFLAASTAEDERLQRLAEADVPASPAFDDILHRSPTMRRAVGRARVLSTRGLTVLIQGESGTGKEMLASAIHYASPRARGPFCAVNLGAVEPSLAASELFGHRRGAFTGADDHHAGYFEAASGGTLFLDEIGECGKDVQVKLLRAIQEGEVTRVGETKPRKVDVRIVAATNRHLVRDVESGAFREDLYYRISLGLIYLPPLREREGDISLLCERLLDEIGTEAAAKKRLSPAARNLLLAHDWPGNVRELKNVLTRAHLWAPPDLIGPDDVRDALAGQRRAADAALTLPLGEGFDIRKHLDDVRRHYVGRAVADAGGSKAKAARLLGLPNYQTLSNWMTEFGLDR